MVQTFSIGSVDRAANIACASLLFPASLYTILAIDMIDYTHACSNDKDNKTRSGHRSMIDKEPYVIRYQFAPHISMQMFCAVKAPKLQSRLSNLFPSQI